MESALLLVAPSCGEHPLVQRTLVLSADGPCAEPLKVIGAQRVSRGSASKRPLLHDLAHLMLSEHGADNEQEVVHNTGEDLVCATSGMRRQRMGTGSTCPFNRATAEGFVPTYRQCCLFTANLRVPA